MSPLIEKARALVEATRRRIHPCGPRHIGAQVRSWELDALKKSEEKQPLERVRSWARKALKGVSQ